MRAFPFLALSAALGALPAHAQESIYIGIGVASLDYEENFTDPLYGKVSDSVDAYKLFGGFEINEHFALEINYRKTDDIVATGGADFPIFGQVTGKLTADFTMSSLMALGQLPFDWGVLLGGLGYFSSDNDFTEQIMADCCGMLVEDSSVGDDGLAATLGIEWRFGRFGTRYGFRLEYEWWDVGDADTSAIGVAFSYGF